jgi:hypothetical protein
VAQAWAASSPGKASTSIGVSCRDGSGEWRGARAKSKRWIVLGLVCGIEVRTDRHCRWVPIDEESSHTCGHTSHITLQNTHVGALSKHERLGAAVTSGIRYIHRPIQELCTETQPKLWQCCVADQRGLSTVTWHATETLRNSNCELPNERRRREADKAKSRLQRQPLCQICLHVRGPRHTCTSRRRSLE